MTDLQTVDQDVLETPPAHNAPADSDTPKYDRLKHADIGKVLRLHDEGLSQALIAQQIGCHQSTVSRVLKDLGDDTSDLATRRFKATALKAADRVIDMAQNARDEDALKAAKVVLAASGVTERDRAINVGVQVIVGTPGSAAVDASTITVQVQE